MFVHMYVVLYPNPFVAYLAFPSATGLRLYCRLFRHSLFIPFTLSFVLSLSRSFSFSFIFPQKSATVPWAHAPFSS